MKKNKLSIYIVFSILIHIVFLLLIQLDESIFHPLKSQKENQQEDRLVFELIETPDVEDQIPDAESDLVSDKNTSASDLNENDLPENKLPFQIGDTAFKTFNDVYPEQKEQNGSSKPNDESVTDILADINKNKPSFLDDFQKRQKLKKLTQNTPEYDQELSSIRNKGGVKFNTYAWDFAPYMLQLKRKVQSNINPPYAFSRLGAIDGNTLIRFKIMQDGSMEDLEIIGSDAHYTLDDTSTRAITYSAPFIPLPTNFPEPYLEVTALFSYLIGNK